METLSEPEVSTSFRQVLDLPVRQDYEGHPASYNPDEVVFMDFGACKTVDPNLFNTETKRGRTALRGSVVIGGTKVKKREQIERARSVCRSCPVLSECAAFIKRYPEDEGVWAATLPEEREEW